MEDKILGFQFEPVSAKRTRPSYNDGSDQDEPETHHNRLSSQGWCNCQKCEKIPTGLECVCCHEVSEVKAFHLKDKARRSWNTAAQEFIEVVVCRCFSEYVFLKVFENSQENTCAKAIALRPATLLKNRLWHRCFPANLAKFLKTPFIFKHLWWLLLDLTE